MGQYVHMLATILSPNYRTRNPIYEIFIPLYCALENKGYPMPAERFSAHTGEQVRLVIWLPKQV
jgi:hypothetical protein